MSAAMMFPRLGMLYNLNDTHRRWPSQSTFVAQEPAADIVASPSESTLTAGCSVCAKSSSFSSRILCGSVRAKLQPLCLPSVCRPMMLLPEVSGMPPSPLYAAPSASKAAKSQVYSVEPHPCGPVNQIVLISPDWLTSGPAPADYWAAAPPTGLGLCFHCFELVLLE